MNNIEHPIVEYPTVNLTISSEYDDTSTIITLNTGLGTILQDPLITGSFDLIWWNSSDYLIPSADPSAEIVRCIAKYNDTLIITRGQGGTLASNKNLAGKIYKITPINIIDWKSATYPNPAISITFVIDGGGMTITTGVKGDLTIPFACNIIEWTLLADQVGSIVVDIWKNTYTNYPPTVSNKITASTPPTISSSTKGNSTILTGWTTAINAGDILRFNVNSATTITRVTMSLKVNKT